MKEIRGKVIKFGDNIDTDIIIAAHRLTLGSDYEKLAQYTFENVDPQFLKKVKGGQTVIVAGRNFGLGSSREQAPYVLKYSGIRAVLAESFARIFFRNAINIGLPALECKNVTQFVQEGDELEVDLNEFTLKNITKNMSKPLKPLPSVFLEIFQKGGLVPYFKEKIAFRKC